MQKYLYLPVYLIVLLSLPGCFGGNSTPIPADHYYRLSSGNTVEQGHKSSILNGTLAVRRLSANGLYQDRSVLFVEADKPLELQRHHYHHWADSPARLVQEDLVKYLRNHYIANKVVRFRPGLIADYYIHGRINRFERKFDSGRVGVVVSLELELRNADQKTILGRDYTRTLDIADPAIYSSINAFDKALQAIYSSFITDMRHQLSVGTG